MRGVQTCVVVMAALVTLWLANKSGFNEGKMGEYLRGYLAGQGECMEVAR